MIELLTAAGLALATVVFYWRTLKYGLVSDDMPAQSRIAQVLAQKPEIMKLDAELNPLRVKPDPTEEDKKKIKELESKRKFHFFEGLYWDLRGIYNVKRSHALTLICHTLTVVAMYFAFHNVWAAALFAFNPVTLMVSVWISGRAYGMVTLFALVSWILPSNAFLLYAAAVYWCISALFYPLVFVYLGWKWAWLVLLIPFALYWRFKGKPDLISFASGSKMMNESNLELRSVKPRKLIIWIKTYGYYFWNSLFCYRLGLFHKFLYLFGLGKKENAPYYKINSRDFYLGLAALGVTGLGILKGNFFQSLGLAWFLVNVGMWCNFITFNQQIAERYLYLPVVGLMLALAATVNPWVCSLFLVYYVSRTWYFMPSFTNEYWNVEYNLAEAKDLHYIWLSRGVHRYAEGNVHDAIRNMLQAYTIRPDDFKVNLNLFYIAVVLNDIALAKKHLEVVATCVVEGKEKECADFTQGCRDLITKIEAELQAKGQCQVDLKEIRLLL